MDPDVQDVTVVQYESVRPPGLVLYQSNFTICYRGITRTYDWDNNILIFTHLFNAVLEVDKIT